MLLTVDRAHCSQEAIRIFLSEPAACERPSLRSGGVKQARRVEETDTAGWAAFRLRPGSTL